MIRFAELLILSLIECAWMVQPSSFEPQKCTKNVLLAQDCRPVSPRSIAVPHEFDPFALKLSSDIVCVHAKAEDHVGTR